MEKVDYEPLRRTIMSALIRLRDWPLWRMVPQGFEVAASAVFVLLIARRDLPESHLLTALKRRVSGIPKLIRDSIDAVDEPYELWIEYAKGVGLGLPNLLNSVKGLGKELGDEELVEECDRVSEEVRKLVEKLGDLRERARPGYKPMGRELLERFLYSTFIEMGVDELRELGYREAERYRKLMAEAAREVGFPSVEEALSALRKRVPRDPEEVLKVYRETVERVRRFVIEAGVVELPPMERVEVVETPEFIKHVIPFAAYIPPEVFGVSSRGTFLVTKPWSKEMLEHHDIYSIINTVVHEAYPGHHVQLSYLRLSPSIVRKYIIEPADFVEGWAHYCEELMLELGIERDPLYKLKVYHDALWRAVRVYLDIELSTGSIDFDKAVEKLSRDAYLPRDGARAEVLRYTMVQGATLSYCYGKARILELKKRVREVLGPLYSDKLFHRLLLEEGNLPLAVLSEVVLDKARKLASSR